jgi:hypothetical protein
MKLRRQLYVLVGGLLLAACIHQVRLLVSVGRSSNVDDTLLDVNDGESVNNDNGGEHEADSSYIPAAPRVLETASAQKSTTAQAQTPAKAAPPRNKGGKLKDKGKPKKNAANKPKFDGMAACLLVKDDNHWLSEWLAYHYHVLPLRHLIVVQDPTSRTSSQPILDVWKNRMSITTWTDAEFVPDWVIQKHKDGDLDDAHLHRKRQQYFYASCLKHLQRQGATWVVLVDTDEFIRPNIYLPNVTTPDLAVSGSVQRWLHERVGTRKDYKAMACMNMPRLQITSTETDPTLLHNDIPVGLNASQFLTTRWRIHNGQEIYMGHNLDGKNILHVQWLAQTKVRIPARAHNAHHIIPHVCPDTNGRQLTHPHSWLIIYHYLGTYEQYAYRQDPRDAIVGRPKRDRALWSKTGQSPPATIRDDSMGAWLTGFVQAHPEDAAQLLARVGVLE